MTVPSGGGIVEVSKQMVNNIQVRMYVQVCALGLYMLYEQQHIVLATMDKHLR